MPSFTRKNWLATLVKMPVEDYLEGLGITAATTDNQLDSIAADEARALQSVLDQDPADAQWDIFHQLRAWRDDLIRAQRDDEVVEFF